MGITRDSLHKRRSTSGTKKKWHKKRKFEMGRQPAMTKLSANKTVRRLRVRGGNYKFRALRLDTGNFAWGTEAVTRKTRVLDVVYNASNNELVRMKILVKNAIVQIDATPFRQWYQKHYGEEVGKKKVKGPAKKEGEAAAKKEGEAEPEETEEEKKSFAVIAKHERRLKEHKLDPHLEEQFASGRLYAAISSRPGQCGRCDGYILEGRELEFYLRKMPKKKGKAPGAA